MKGITPIISIIILLLITIGLAGAAWTYMSGYFSGLTARYIEVGYSYCDGNVAKIMLTNRGTSPLPLNCEANGNILDCKNFKIIKKSAPTGHEDMKDPDGGTTNFFDAESFKPGESVIFSEQCTEAGTPGTCVYVVISGTKGGTQVMIECAGGEMETTPPPPPPGEGEDTGGLL